MKGSFVVGRRLLYSISVAMLLSSPYLLKEGGAFQQQVPRSSIRATVSKFRDIRGTYQQSRLYIPLQGTQTQNEYHPTSSLLFRSGLFNDHHHQHQQQPYSISPFSPEQYKQQQQHCQQQIIHKTKSFRHHLSWWFRRTKQRLSTQLLSYKRWLRRTVVVLTILCMIHLTALTPPPAWAAAGSGRMGGSFGSSGGGRNHHGGTGRVYRSPSSSSSSSRSFSSSPYSSSSYGKIWYDRSYRPPVHIFFRPAPQLQLSTTADSGTAITTTKDFPQHQRGLTEPTAIAAGIVWGVFFGTVAGFGISKQLRGRIDNNNKNNSDYPPDSLLGPGVSVLSITACLNVPNRDDPNNVLRRLQNLADTSDTGSRKGLQRLLADTSLELLRQDRAVVSAQSRYQHFHRATTQVTDAERSFRTLSTNLRSKFERESRSNYNGEVVMQQQQQQQQSSGESNATMAIVGINLAIEGNSMEGLLKKNVKTRMDLKKVLTQLSSDVQVGDCLLSAEVIWSPDDETEQLQLEDVYADFPTLNLLLD